MGRAGEICFMHDLLYVWSALPAQQKEIVPVQMDGDTEKCTLVAHVAHLFPQYFVLLTANDKYPWAKSFIAV